VSWSEERHGVAREGEPRDAVITGNHDDLTPDLTRVAASGYIIKSQSTAPVPTAAPTAVADSRIYDLLDERVSKTKQVHVDVARLELRAKNTLGVLPTNAAVAPP
jgi:hypothetical protein